MVRPVARYQTEEDLLKHQNLGPTTLYEIKNRLAMVGFQ